MDKLTNQIRQLNEIYRSMKKNFDILKKMFNKESTIKQKIILTEQMLGQVYMSIKDKLENEEINSEFNQIIKQLKKK